MNLREGFKRLSILIGILTTIVFFIVFANDSYGQIGLLVIVSLVIGIISSGITLLMGYVIAGFLSK